MPIDTAPLGSILSLWAHPDDETYLAGGVMAAARAAGQRVVCVTATAGEQGTDDAMTWPPARLGQVRRWEARAAMAVLGVEEHRCLGLPDGGLDALEDEGTAMVCDLLEELQPDTILTFGPGGVTFHPDHMAVSRWARTAWAARGGGIRLLWSAQTPGYLARFRRIFEASGMYMADLRPVGVAAEHMALLLDLGDEQVDQKLTALRAMATQTAGTIAAIDPATFAASLAEEGFVDGR